MASKLYALESTAYMTAGLADASMDGDIEVESVITRQLASDTADFVVNNCLQLLGSSVQHESSKHQQYLRDSTILVRLSSKYLLYSKIISELARKHKHQ